MTVPARARVMAAAVCLLLTTAVAAQNRITMDRQVTGTLSSSDKRLEDGSYYHEWTFTATGGTRITITMTSSAFDAYLHLGRYTASGGFESLDSDDDSAGGRNARITFTIPTSGEYVIRANTLDAGQTGTYALLLAGAAGERAAGAAPAARAAAPSPASPRRFINSGEMVSGRLDASDPKESDNSYYEQWIYQGVRGERLRIVMRSSDFDAYLKIGTLNGGVFTELENDDDGGGDRDALVEFTLPNDGEFAIRANSLEADETGAYTLLLLSQR